MEEEMKPMEPGPGSAPMPIKMRVFAEALYLKGQRDTGMQGRGLYILLRTENVSVSSS